MLKVLGFKVDKPTKILIKISNPAEYIELMILSSNIDYNLYSNGSLKGLLDLLFNVLHQHRKRRKEIIITRLAWTP